MDSVIINSKQYVEEFWLKKFDEYGIDIPEEKQEKRFHGRPARPTVNDFFAELDESTREQIIEEYAVYDASAESYPMIPGVHAQIKRKNLIPSIIPIQLLQ